MGSILDQLRAEGDADVVGSGPDQLATGPRSSINAFDLLLRAVKGAPGQMLEQDLLTRGLVGSGFGTQAFGTPQTKVAPGAFALRVAPGLIPNP
ncbi:MAG: hypothetical protein FJ027_23470, partial [Candidatus Rokubacteria bacterium]|nr:hypothetical protein [Candidatus Rokubacteria bacterium]